MVDGPPASFVLDGELYELSGDWLRVLLEHLPRAERWHLWVLFALLHPGDAERLGDRLDDEQDPLGAADLESLTEKLVERACGRPWWVSQRLFATLEAVWGELDGELALRGVELERMAARPARACDLVYAWLIRGADDKARRRLDAQLNRPPAVLRRRKTPPSSGPWSPQAQGEAFLAAMRDHADTGGRVRRAVP